MNKVYIARDKVSGKFLKFYEIYDDGFGFFRPSVAKDEIDLTDKYNTPSFFDKPVLPEYVGIIKENDSWRTAPRIEKEQIEFFVLEMTLTPVK